MSAESFSYGYYSDLASLLLVDRDVDTVYVKVDRQKGLSYIKFVPVENKEKRKYSLDEGVFEDSIFSIAEDINGVFSGGTKYLQKSISTFSIRSVILSLCMAGGALRISLKKSQNYSLNTLRSKKYSWA